MTRERASFALLFAAALLCRAMPSRADTPVLPEQDAVFRNGLDQYARGNNVAAITTWESLLGTLGEERGFKVLYNLGLAYQAIGDVSHAIERYRAFVKQVGARTEVPSELAERAADAQSRLEQLERSHGAVNVKAPARGGLVLTRVGSSEPRAAGYVVWLAPGHHDIELFVGTDHVKKLKVDVVQGQTLDIDTSPPEEPPSAAVAAPPPVVAKPPPQPTTWIWIGATATVVSCALPLVSYLVASSHKDDATALGRGNSGYADARSSFDTWRTVSYVSYALPASLALATIGYVVFRPTPSGATVGLHPTGVSLRAEF
jgi:hypothetical protein